MDTAIDAIRAGRVETEFCPVSKWYTAGELIQLAVLNWGGFVNFQDRLQALAVFH